MGWLFRFGLWLAHWFSPSAGLRTSYWLAGILQRLQTTTTRVTQANIDACFPQLCVTERAELSRRSLQHMILYFFEFAQLCYWPQDKLLGRISEVEGAELLDEYAEKHQGAVILIPHLGNWEMFSAYLGTHYGFSALYDPPKISSIEPVIVAARQRFSGRMFPISAGGMRGLLKSLQQGNFVLVLPDQVPERDQGVYAPFFGRPALTMTLAHRLASKCDHRVVLACIERVLDAKSYHYRLRIQAMPEEMRDLDSQAFAEMLNGAIEDLVRRSPEQYQWEYKRFKRPPEARKSSLYLRQ